MFADPADQLGLTSTAAGLSETTLEIVPVRFRSEDANTLLAAVVVEERIRIKPRIRRTFFERAFQAQGSRFVGKLGTIYEDVEMINETFDRMNKACDRMSVMMAKISHDLNEMHGLLLQLVAQTKET